MKKVISKNRSKKVKSKSRKDDDGFRMTIGMKLIAGFLFVAILVAVTGLMGLTQMSTIDHDADVILEEEYPVADASMELTVALEEELVAVHAYMVGETEAVEEFNDANDDFNTWLDNLKAADLDSEEQSTLTNIEDEHDNIVSRANDLFATTNTSQQMSIMEDIDLIIPNMDEELKNMEEHTDQRMDEAMQDADKTYTDGRTYLIAVTVAAFAGAVILGYYLSRKISKPIKGVAEVADSLSEGNLKKDIDIDAGNDEVGDMVLSFSEMKDNITNAFGRIGNTVGDLEKGKMDSRVKHSDLKGEYAKIGRDVNGSVKAIKNSMDGIKEVMRGLAEGDLTNKIDVSELDGEYAKIGEAVNQSIGDVKESIRNIMTSAGELDNAAETVAASSEEMSSTSENVSTSVQGISEGAAEQAKKSEDLSQTVEGISATMEETSASAEDIAASAEEVSAQTDEGREHAEEVSESVNDLQEDLEKTKELAFELDEQSDEIGQLIETISGIADQTNLLALNAAIEAARAGEHGKGFAVVADSVRDLAEETQEETERIKKIIEQTQINASDVVEGVKDVTTMSESAHEATKKNKQSLEEINDAIASVSEAIQNISSGANEVSGELQEASDQVEKVAEIADENSGKAEASAASAEEQNASVEELSSAAQQLSGLAAEINDLVREYELE